MSVQMTAATVRPFLAAAMVGLLVAGSSAAMVEVTGESRPNPISQVVNLLQKMRTELENEARNEADMYDKMVCWCETNEKEKTKAIADADVKDNQLTAEIETRTARVSALSVNIAASKKEIAENTKSLDKASAIREEEATKFRKEEKDMVQAIANLRNAVTVLAKHQGASMMQMGSSMLSGLRVLLRAASVKYEVLVAARAESHGRPKGVALMSLSSARSRATTNTAEGAVSASLLSAMDAHGAPVSDNFPLKFAEQLVAKAASTSRGARSFLQVHNAGKQPGASGGIYGVLTQMLDEFEAELKTSRADEQKAQADFKELTATKTEEIETGKVKLDEMELEAADNSKALSDAKEDLKATRAQRTADVNFLQNLKVTCDNLDAQWEKRSKTRTAEMKAVSEAMAVLTEEDTARAAFSRGFFFLQERSQRSGKASAAAAVLKTAAEAPDLQMDDLEDAWKGRQGGHLAGGALSFAAESSAGPRARLSTLAVAVQIDSFSKVKKMMDTMIAELKKQQSDEVGFKDHCQNEIRSTENEIVDKKDLKKDLETKIAKLESLVGRADEEIAKAKEQIAETEAEIKKASQTREEENKEFQSVVTEQRAAQPIIKKALRKLEDFYKRDLGKAVLAQRSAQTPPVQFQDYEANSGSKAVIGLLEQIIEDSVKLEKEATEAETKAQLDYESFVKDSAALKSTLETTVATKTKAISSSKSDSAEAGEDFESTTGELESLAAVEADLHNECDWLLKNFDIRQKARLHEIESIQEAKGILSGA